MNDQRRIADEFHERRRDLTKLRLVAQLLHRNPVDGLRIRMNVAILGMDVYVEGVAGRNAIDQFDTSDFDDAVPAAGVEARGLGVEHDLAQHGLSSP